MGERRIIGCLRGLCAVFIAALLANSTAYGQTECTHAAACNSSITGQLDFESGTCLDANTNRYQVFPFTGSSSATITATVQSAFFAPALTLIGPDAIAHASDPNPLKKQFAVISATLNVGGIWYVRVSNIDVGTGGLFSLAITCGSSGPPPPPPPPTYLALSLVPTSITLQPNQSATLHLTSTAISPFASDVSVSIGGPSDVSISPSALSFLSPGSGAAEIVVAVGPTPPGGTYPIIATAQAAGGITALAGTSLTIDAPCYPPVVIKQPVSASAIFGSRVTLSVGSSGTAPLSYQWYQGFSGATHFPDPAGIDTEYQTPPITSDSQFWVRVANRCGSRDSNAATITVAPAIPRRRSVRH